MAISQFLLFVGAIAGFVSLVPLATWAATGRLRDAWEALRGYLLCMAILGGVVLIFIVCGVIGSMA